MTREETGAVSDTVEEGLQLVEHEISGEMQQPRKSYWNRQALQNVKKFQLLKNLSEAKLDYSQPSKESNQHWSSGYQSASSARNRDYMPTETEADIKPKIHPSKIIKKKRQKFIQPSLANSAQIGSDQPYSNSIGDNKQVQTKSMNQLVKSGDALQNTLHKLAHQYGVLRLQDLQQDCSQSQSLSNGEISKVNSFEPNSAQKVKNMIKLVKSSAKKLQPEQLNSIQKSVKASQKQNESREKQIAHSANKKTEKQEDCPTPKASSRIILKASKANNLVNTQPPLKKQRGSQDSNSIRLLAKELRKKGAPTSKFKVAKQKTLNQSHNLNSADNQISLHSQSHREYSNEELKMSPKALHYREGEVDPADTVQKKYPSLRMHTKMIKQEIADISPVQDLLTPELKLSELSKHESRLERAKMKNNLSKTSRFLPGFAEANQNAIMRIEIQDTSRDHLDFNKTQTVRFTGSGRTPGKELLKIVSPKKIDQINKGVIQLQGDQQSMRQSQKNVVGDNVSALSSFTTPSLDQRLNEIQKIDRTQASIGNLMFNPSSQEPNFFIRQLAVNPKEVSPSHMDQESNEKTSFGESDSLDVDEEICTRSHFDKLKDLHQAKLRVSTLQPLVGGQINGPMNGQMRGDDYQPENVRESRRVSDARDLMTKHQVQEQNNKIVSAGNDAFSSRINKLKSEAEKAERKHQNRQKSKAILKPKKASKVEEKSKVINTSIQPCNKSKFFNPTENMTHLAQHSNPSRRQPLKTKSALSEMYPTNGHGGQLLGQRTNSDYSSTPPGHSSLIQPSHLFGSRKQSRIVINYFKVFLCPHIHMLSRIMQFLPLDACFRLKLISLSKSITRDPTMRGSFEIQFFLAIIGHRQGPQQMASIKPSKLCSLLANFLSLTFRLNRDQERELAFVQNKSTQRMHFNMSADTASMTGVAFEIQKDVDRTFQDQSKFNSSNRQSLATVLKAFAEVDQEIGYVQGLNFIVGNFILLFDKTQRDHSQKRTERRTLATFLGLLRVLDTRSFYTEHMSGIKEAIFKLECILYNLIPEVYIYLMQNQITLEYFVSQWFLTLFQYDVDSHEQCMTIVLLCFFFGEKVMFQIAFQMIKEIRGKLVNFSYEEALVYLKDYAGEARFTKVDFLMRALENDLITSQLVNDLSKVYEKFRSIYSDKEISKLSFLDLNPLSQRVRFLRDLVPGKINVKVIWPKGHMSESPNLEKGTEYKSESEVQVTEFSLQMLPTRSQVTGHHNFDQKENAIAFQRPDKLRKGPSQPKPKVNTQSLIIASEESQKNKPIQAIKPRSKRMVGSFAIQAGVKPSTSFSDLATVSEISKNTDMKNQIPEIRTGVHMLQLAKGRSEVKAVNELRNSQVFNVEEGENDLKANNKFTNSSLFERLGIQSSSSPLQTSVNNSKTQRNPLFSLIQSSQKQPEFSHRSSEKPSYLRFPLKQPHSSRTSEESSHKTTRIKIVRNNEGTLASSSSKTHSDNISQETDLLESENSYPLMLRVQQSSGMRVHQDRTFDDDELLVGNEYSTIDPPLFLSPQASNQINSRAMYRKDNQKVLNNFQVYERNIVSAKQVKDELVRPGTKTKLEQRNNVHQPTQSNFDIESETQTLSNTLAQSGMKFPNSPNGQDQPLRLKKAGTVKGFRVPPSENIVESDKRMKQVNNIALTGAGFENLRQIGKHNSHPMTKQSPSAVKIKNESQNQEMGNNPMFEHLPLKETVKFKQPAMRLSLPKTPEPVPLVKTIEVPLSNDKLSGNGANPSHQMQGLRNQETKKNQLHRNSSQVTEEEQPMQQNAPIFMHKFLALSKDLRPKTGSKVIQIAEQVSARSGDSIGSPLNLDDKLPNHKNRSHFGNYQDQQKKSNKGQVNYNTREQFSTIRFATQQKNYQVSNHYPQPKTQVETPNMTQTLVRPLNEAIRRKV